MREHLRLVLSVGAVLGTLAGAADGLWALAHNTYIPGFALFWMSAPLPLTILLLFVAGVPIAVAGRLRAAPAAAGTPGVAGQLVAVIAALWGLRWWESIAAQIQRAGGGGLAVALALLPVLALALGTGGAVRWVLMRVDPVRLRRSMRRGAVAGVVLAVLSVAYFILIGFQESHLLFYDKDHGPVRRPNELNVLLITLDTLRADRLASFDGRAGLTAALDRLAAEGAAFTTAISQSPWTLPSVVSMLTGVAPASHGTGWSANAFDLLARTPLAAGVWTLPQALREHGYFTQAFVTNPYLSMRYGLGTGFDRYENVTLESEAFLALGDTLAFRLLIALWPRLVISDVGETITTRAEHWLAEHHDERFFLWLHYVDMHAPYGDPRVLGSKSFRGDHLDSNVWQPAMWGSDAALGDRFIPIARLRAGEIHLNAAQRQQLVDLYDAGVRYDDEQVGRVLAQVDALGLRAHTLIVVASDHGEEFWDHGGVEHGHTLYDELVRVPLLIQWPGGPVGRRIRDVVRLMDIAPTIIDLTDAGSTPATLEGRSLRSLLAGVADTPRTALSESMLFSDEKRALRTDRFKYIVWANGKEELYDFVADPRELRDLAGNEDLLAKERVKMRTVGDAQRRGQQRPTLPIDATTREQLRALGYVE